MTEQSLEIEQAAETIVLLEQLVEEQQKLLEEQRKTNRLLEEIIQLLPM
jgi:hypothetical protein